MEPLINARVADRIRDRLGNPLFAFETSLDPLRLRIREHRVAEAKQLAEQLEASVREALERTLQLRQRYARNQVATAAVDKLRSAFALVGMLCCPIALHLEKTEIDSTLALVGNVDHVVQVTKSWLP